MQCLKNSPQKWRIIHKVFCVNRGSLREDFQEIRFLFFLKNLKRSFCLKADFQSVIFLESLSTLA